MNGVEKVYIRLDLTLYSLTPGLDTSELFYIIPQV